MTGSTSYELGRQQGMQEAQHRILELEQRLAGWPDLFDENMLLKTELEQYRSIAEQVGASKAVSELEQAIVRIQELEQQLEEAIEYQIVLVNEKNQFRQQLEEAHTELSVSIKERLVLGEQNAKLVEALEKISNCMPWPEEKNAEELVKIAAAALKTMEAQDE